MTLPVFESTVQKTHIWLNEIARELGTEDKHLAYLSLRSVLQTLRDHLTTTQVAQLGAQLPMLVRGFYYEGWVPNQSTVKERGKKHFLEHVYKAFKTDPYLEPDVRPEAVVRAVLLVLQHHVSQGEISDVKALLPEQLRSLWPEAHELVA